MRLWKWMTLAGALSVTVVGCGGGGSTEDNLPSNPWEELDGSAGVGGSGGSATAGAGGMSDGGTGGSTAGGAGGSSTGGVGGEDGGPGGSGGEDAATGGAGGDDASSGGTGGDDAGTGGAAGSAGAAGAGGAGGSGTGGAAGAGGSGAGGTGTGGTGGAPAECITCHGSVNSPAPPKDLAGNLDTTAPGVGAHQSHLATSNWHHDVACTECHIVPSTPFDATVPTHMNGTDDVIWGAIAKTGTFDSATYACSGTYCHGGSLQPDAAGQTSNRTPAWTTVDGSQAECGTSCHTLPPGGSHPAVTGACEACHGAVISSFNASNPSASAWANSDLHIDGKVDVTGLTCTSCHGDSGTNNPAPPLGTNGETATTDPAVGAHRQHLATSTWHRDVACEACHAVPTSTSHSNGVVDFSWSSPADADGASPAFVSSNNTCTSTYCHGATLLGANAGGTVNRTPVWTEVNGTWNECGTTCHTNPPGGTHPTSTGCPSCHGTVIATYDPATKAATWADKSLHINGTVEASGAYHDLANWESPKGQANHHGSNYFLTNQQRDEHDVPCTTCHGANLDGGTSGVSCNNTSCHGGNWRSCTFCHGTPPSQNNPPLGVGGETTTSTLAVGRHAAHLTASNTHVAFACGTCHTVPGAGDVTHTLGYVPTTSLATAGHHGDVTFSAPATAMTFDVNAITGNPVSARGTCLGACHSNGRGGSPVVTPYWAGGSWTAGSCGNCHAASPTTGRHNNHVGEATCTDCHPAANTSTHMDGTATVNASVGGLTITKGGGNCGTRYSCTGTCHGKSHNYCW